ncbi:protein NLRC3-like [Dermacentor albipictus]|uniref:protein NLRC3-like n=1 Tax=Dermacentor albipictus TaxID=60249 RepID=UPI0038FC6B1F
MADAVVNEGHTQDTDVKEFLRKGLQRLGPVDELNPAGVTDESIQQGADLEYTEKLSDKDAGLLRRLLSSGTPVRKLCIFEISHGAFKVAFHNLEECPSLQEVLLLHIDCEEKDLDMHLCGAFRGLRSLDLRCDNTGSGFAKEIARYIHENKSLRELSLWNSCGGDEGAAALIEVLTVNETLKRFTLAAMELSSDTLIGFVKMLASNSTLELVDLFDVCPAEKDQVSRLLETELYASAFKRLRILWPEQLLPQVTTLLRQQACSPELSVSVTSSVDEVVLREFFDAVAADTTLRMLHFYPSEDVFDALADGIASVVKRTKTLREICNLMRVQEGKERQLVNVLNALKENRSVTNFTMYAELLTAEVAASLSELLAVNNTLNDVAICEYWGILPDQVETILQGLRNNYTLTGLMVSWDPDDSDGISEMEELLKRNVRLQKKAAEFVISGSGDVSDVEGAGALKKLHSSAGLVEKVRELTGKTREAALEEIQSALARLSA